MLRLGGGLDNGERVRRGHSLDSKYIYVEQNTTTPATDPILDQEQAPLYRRSLPGQKSKPDPNEGLIKKKGALWEPSIILPQPLGPRTPNRPIAARDMRSRKSTRLPYVLDWSIY
jgi:WD repeat and SOF domain-containing protein 1